MYFVRVETTLTDLQRSPQKMKRAIDKGQTVTLTSHGKPVAHIVPTTHRNKAAAARALLAIGPVNLPRRK
jgi:prevent-host-death family protein